MDRRRRPLSKTGISASHTSVSQISTTAHAHWNNVIHKIRFWLCAWEIYPIIIVAAFLRFYQLNTTEFDEDQAIIFRMAHDAIFHGLLPATSNIASIRIVNPPAVIYLLMLPAAFSANPLGGAVLVGLFNVIAVLLTYLFVRRYYGRLAGIIASLLYATASEPLLFSRFIWQQNLIAPFAILFMFALFRGVVERRKGWLFPALLLLGILFQLHETTIILFVPLLVALLLAPGTVRWRDLALGIGSLFLIFFTYLLWEFSTKFADLSAILQMSKSRAQFDNQALTYYQLFLSPYAHVPTNMHTLLYALVPLLKWSGLIMPLLVAGGFAAAVLSIVVSRPAWESSHVQKHKPTQDDTGVPSLHPSGSNTFRTIWIAFRSHPRRCGLALLLVWQVVPILILSRHSVPVYPYYLLMLMPGPFILIGLFLSWIVDWLRQFGRQWSMLQYGVYAVACFVIIAQSAGTTASLLDQVSGNNLHGYTYNTLNSLQNALAEADHVARQRHLNHVYITTNQFTQVALRYLAEQVQTPTTLFDASRCLVLPNPADGPAVLLVGPYDKLTSVLLGQFATSTLIDRPERLGGAPFQLFIVKPITIALSRSTSSQAVFLNNLQLLDKRVRHFSYDNSLWLATYWRLLRSASPGYRTTYTYAMRALLNGSHGPGISSQCISTSMRVGDQLIVAFQVPRATVLPVSVTISATSYTTMPYNLPFGPFHLETIRDQSTPQTTLTTLDGRDAITLSG